MSSLVERLRVRSEKRPLYLIDESDDEDFVASKGSKKKPHLQDEKERVEGAVRVDRDDAKEDACRLCGESEDLVPCATCTYTFHKKCLYPPSRIACMIDNWSCPECVSPLAEIEKFLDCELRPVPEDKNDPTNSTKVDVKHYLVKWKNLSYLHCTWVSEKEFIKASKTHPRLKTRLNNFDRQMESTNKSEDEWVAIRPEWTTVDRVVASRRTLDGREYLVKWKELAYDECTWEMESDISAFKAEIDRYNKIHFRGSKKFSTKGKKSSSDTKEPSKSKENEEPSKSKQSKEPLKSKQDEESSKPKPNEETSKFKQNDFHHYDQSPDFLSGGKLHPYQLEGLNFLRYSWAKNTHVILADEMGLGKTIQSIAFLASLYKENLSPHLVVAPLSTLRNWEREFATWAPKMNVVMYFGSSQAREVIRKYEFYYPKETLKKHMKKKKLLPVDNKKKQARIKFNVLLTSYEMVNMDSAVLKQIQWECMIVDEGHRLKNKDSKLFHQLKLFSPKHRVLLTGTPLQNNLDELFMLMHFLDAGKFASIEDFQKEFKDINQEEQVDRLHKMLAPHLLRRVKKDVMKDLPPKTELILRVELSSIQKEYYKAILTRNYSILARRGGPQVSLINVVMELRKLCCHAYMLEGVEAATETSEVTDGVRRLSDASGKMQLLDKMMVKLKEQGHRVLIYSQFQHMLDILEDYLSYRKWTYERIDGKVSGAERQIRIDRFNAKNSNRFCFLLSTRAGGLGINLATADTVIIYDSDWNPHADLQAMARAHRLGQTNKVMIYRLITRGTIEERMMQLTKKKMILEHLVVGRLKTQSVNQEELDDIIRYGSMELFADESEEAKARQIHYDDAAIDRLLNRDNVIGEEASVDEEDDDFLKAFKVANFEYIDEVEAAAAAEEELKKQAAEKASSSSVDRANFWDDLLRDKYEVLQIEESNELNAMGKGRRNRRQMTAAEEDMQDASSEDEDYCFEDDLSDTEINAGNAPGKRGPIPKKKRENFEYPLMEGEGRSFRVLGFNQNQRSLFLQLLMRFGFQDYTWKEFVHRLKGKSWQEIHNYGSLFMSHLCEGVNDSPTFSDGVPKEGARVDDIMVRCGHIQLIEEKVLFMSRNPGANLFSEDILLQFPGLTGRFWKAEHDLQLLRAILKHGFARWQYIAEDEETGISETVRKELNLPSGLFPESGQTNESFSSSQLPNSSTQTPGETAAVANGGQVYQDSAATLQSRELQRRVVDFIRKRYMLIEKALDNEFAMKGYKPCEQTTQDQGVHPVPLEANNHNILHSEQLLKQLPKLEKITLDEPVQDNKKEQLDMGHLYNAMCRVVDDSASSSVQAFFGNELAMSRMRGYLQQLEIIHNEVNGLLLGEEPAAAGESSSANVTGDDTSALKVV